MLKLKEYEEILSDSFSSNDQLLEALIDTFNIDGKDLVTMGYIKDWGSLYQFTGERRVEKLLYSISICKQLSIFSRYEASKALLQFSELEEESDEEFVEENNKIRSRNATRQSMGYKALNAVCNVIDSSISTPLRFSMIIELAESNLYKCEAILYLRNLIIDYDIECEYRYARISDLSKFEFELVYEYRRQLSEIFLFDDNNMTYYRNLAAQWLLTRDGKEMLSLEAIDKIESQILCFAKDKDLDYNRRADCADMLMRLGTECVKNEAIDILNELSSDNGNVVRTVYDDGQNVHAVSIETSVVEIIEQIYKIDTMRLNDSYITFNNVKGAIYSILQKRKEHMNSITTDKECIYCNSSTSVYCSSTCDTYDKSEIDIKAALNRIEMDTMVYSKLSVSLQTLLVKLWSYISKHEYKEELTKRLLEELIDMSDTCSSGYCSRLVNVLSGYNNFSLNISFDEQIASNVLARLNKYARNIDDTDSIFRTTKLNDMLKLYLYKHSEIYDSIHDSLSKKDCIVKQSDARDCDSAIIFNEYKQCNTVPIQTMVDTFLNYDKENTIDMCLDWFKDSVLNEMIVDTSNWDNRKAFLLFFRSYILSITEELYSEFIEYMDDVDFDLYMRKAIIMYEGC